MEFAGPLTLVNVDDGFRAKLSLVLLEPVRLTAIAWVLLTPLGAIISICTIVVPGNSVIGADEAPPATIVPSTRTTAPGSAALGIIITLPVSGATDVL